MSFSRRNFLQTLTVAAASTALRPPVSIIKPPRLKPGDTVALVGPAAPAFTHETVQIAVESLQALGFKTVIAKHVFDRYGYLAGTDADRAADLNAMFADSGVNAIMAMHGGWGCARLLPLLDYNLIRRNPKILVGYSDITALLLGIYAQTGLVTMHGAVGSATFNPFTVNYFRQTLVDAQAVLMENPHDKGDLLAQVKDRVMTLHPGKARGRLVGGNLTVLSHLMGSKYLPDWTGCLLFLEDIGEDVYRMDRMITQLKLAGVLDQISGFVFGKCTDCEPGKGYGSLTLEDVFRDHIVPLKKPAYSGAMIGHITHKFTVPLGIEAEIDADAGTLHLLEPAVR
ncbi:S66 peptidase family protein [Larkinella terrae]|uniref:Twin-arginine translocation signal domain-containing protein n=1 Tax=Larkinella terrae TaxID=2025311 RepID=A0A7K0EE03_9BACT|nr:LD-carboxypeptidase [Larkinella terrae]MRS59932.1 twin-arginine translocation signal domain-containing protein [Larkinella terrae]